MYTCSHTHRACWQYQIYLKCSISLKRCYAIKSIKNDLSLTLRMPWNKGSSCLWSSDCHTHMFYVAKYFAIPKKDSIVLWSGQWFPVALEWSQFKHSDAIVTTVTTKPSDLFLWSMRRWNWRTPFLSIFIHIQKQILKSFIGPNKWFSSSPRYSTGKQKYGYAPGED